MEPGNLNLCQGFSASWCTSEGEGSPHPSFIGGQNLKRDKELKSKQPRNESERQQALSA